jgi:hypothetical protein
MYEKRVTHGYKPTNHYCLNYGHTYQWYKWIGLDERGGKWVRIEQ